MIAIRKSPLFPLGRIVATPGAIELLEESKTSASELLNRHVTGDFGDLGPEDLQANLDAIRDDARILSAYKLPAGKIWVISEADRSSTCLLRPEEY